MLLTPRSRQDDQSALVRIIREIFDRSPLFQNSRISEPHTGPEGGVSVEVCFGSRPALFHIVAPCPEQAYAILYEVAMSLVSMGRVYTGGSQSQGERGCIGTVDGTASAEVWTA
ncbi:MAG TPA: hypothetical protein VN203_02905 [Candidatus Acidoferrum sp.]|nr:hypothetical protein [Candidatus Acidoferrum sp.]